MENCQRKIGIISNSNKKDKNLSDVFKLVELLNLPNYLSLEYRQNNLIF